MNRAAASSSWPSQTLWPAPHCVLWVLFTWLCRGDIIKCWVCFWAGRLWGAIFWDGNWLWGRRPVLRVIWWGQRVPGALGGGRRGGVSPRGAGLCWRGQHHGDRPCQHRLHSNHFPDNPVPSFCTRSLLSWPLPNCGSIPCAFPFLRIRNHLMGTHVPLQTAGIWARDLGHPSRRELPPEPLHREPVIRDACSEVLPGHPRRPFGLLHWDYWPGPAKLRGPEPREGSGQGWELSWLRGRGSPWLRGVGTPTEGMVDRGHSGPRLRRGGFVPRTLAGPAWVWFYTRRSVGPAQLWGWCTWWGRVDASDDQSCCRGWEITQAGQLKAVLGPRFQWSSVFPGNCSYLYIYIYIKPECKGMAVMFSVKKKRKSKNNKAMCMASVTSGHSHCCSHLGLSFSHL